MLKLSISLFVCITGLFAHRDHKDFIKREILPGLDACMPQFCENSLMTSTDVLDFCKKENGFVDNRCCLQNSTSGSNVNLTTITGLDYTKCKLTALLSVIKTLPEGSVSNVEIFDIRENEFTECDYQAFAGFLNLKFLFYPPTCSCPGADFSWSKIANDSCSGKLNLCGSNFTNVECTANSECAENGPGNFVCNCKNTYHGYKCMQKDSFPQLVFTIIICGSTLFLCALLWHNQRRLVIKTK